MIIHLLEIQNIILFTNYLQIRTKLEVHLIIAILKNLMTKKIKAFNLIVIYKFKKNIKKGWKIEDIILIVYLLKLLREI